MSYATIVSSSWIGLYLPAGGTVTNPASIDIISSLGVEIAHGYGVVINSGEIAGIDFVAAYKNIFGYHDVSAPSEGVFLLSGGSVTNTTSGMILGGNDGVYIRGGVGAVLNYAE